MVVNDQIREAVADVMGYIPENSAIRNAVAACDGCDTAALRDELRTLTAAFELAGGRGVEPAERIDALRIALAVRSVPPAAGPVKYLDVYLDSGICLEVPADLDPDTPEGFRRMYDLALPRFLEKLQAETVDLDYEWYTGKDDGDE